MAEGESAMTVKSFKVAVAGAIAATALMSTPAAHAAIIDWTTWGAFTVGATSGSITGTAGSVGISYSGELENFFSNYPSYTPTSTFSGGTISNAPPSTSGIIQLFGGASTPVTDTITFSHAVVNPVMAIWSLGQGGINASFNFAEPVAIESGGPSAEYGGVSITGSGNTVSGAEGNGTIQFIGTYTSVSWTNPTTENWYGFTVGVGAVPEPSTWAMLLLGFAGLGFAGYRRTKARVSFAAA